MLVILALAFIISALSFISRSDFLAIKEVEISGNVVTDTEDIQKIADTVAAGYLLWIFPKTNTFIYPTKKVKQEIEDSFPRIETVRVKHVAFSKIAITLKERVIYALWCVSDGEVLPADETASETTADKCYFLDKSGYIFAEAPLFSGDVYLRFYGELTEQNPERHFYLPAEIFAALSRFIDGVKLLGLSPQTISAGEGPDFEIGLSNGKILFEIESDLNITLENLHSLLSSNEFGDNPDASLSRLDYIDLRFGNKLFYKLD